MRAFFGLVTQQYLSALGINASEAFSPEELAWLETGDMIYKTLPVVGFLAITVALAIEMYRRSTEGQRYQL